MGDVIVSIRPQSLYSTADRSRQGIFWLTGKKKIKSKKMLGGHFFFPTSHKVPCPDLSTVEYKGHALTWILVVCENTSTPPRISHVLIQNESRLRESVRGWFRMDPGTENKSGDDPEWTIEHAVNDFWAKTVLHSVCVTDTEINQTTV